MSKRQLRRRERNEGPSSIQRNRIGTGWIRRANAQPGLPPILCRGCERNGNSATRSCGKRRATGVGLGKIVRIQPSNINLLNRECAGARVGYRDSLRGARGANHLRTKVKFWG